MNKLTILAALTVAVFGSAHAGTPGYDIKNNRPLSQNLEQLGYAEVSEGLYQSKGGSGQGFVALTDKGRSAMANKLLDLRARFEKIATNDGVSAGEKRLLQTLSDSVARLNKVSQASKTVINRGECASFAQIAAGASASNGDSAMAAAGVTLDFSPVTPTGNYAIAATDNTYDVDYGEGFDWAQASTYEYGSCMSFADAGVSCPDGGGVNAYEYSVSPNLYCQPR
jgi:hypothetical protein